ncbi:MAG: endonuclease/exonuclease/phosphatase family protein [Pseudomonadota bacterium]
MATDVGPNRAGANAERSGGTRVVSAIAVGLLRVVAATLVLAVALSFLSPVLAVADALANFRHMMMGLAVLLALSAALMKLRMLSAVLAAAALSSALSMPELLPPRLSPNAGDQRLRLLQFNVNLMNSQADAFAALVASAQPDVVTLQEISPANRHFLRAVAEDFPHQRVCPFTTQHAVAILSRHPPVAPPACHPGLGLVALRIALEGRPLTVASLHLRWPWPYGQAEQVASLEPVLSALPQPLVFAGDFNAAPWTRAVRRLADASDTRVISGLRTTIWVGFYNRQVQVPLPIDHVLVPRGAQTSRIEVGGASFSDHLPVLAEITLPHR